jgi:hypothetical protein
MILTTERAPEPVRPAPGTIVLRPEQALMLIRLLSRVNTDTTSFRMLNGDPAEMKDRLARQDMSRLLESVLSAFYSFDTMSRVAVATHASAHGGRTIQLNAIDANGKLRLVPSDDFMIDVTLETRDFDWINEVHAELDRRQAKVAA